MQGPLEGGDSVHQPVRAQIRGGILQDRHSGLDARLNKERLQVEVLLADLAECGVDGRHHRGNNDVRHLAGIEAVHLEEIDEEHAVFVGGLGAMGGDSPVRRQLRLLDIRAGRPCRRGPRFFRFQPVEAQHRIRIAHIDG
jgi:hypothetical protein